MAHIPLGLIMIALGVFAAARGAKYAFKIKREPGDNIRARSFTLGLGLILVGALFIINAIIRAVRGEL